MEEKLYGEFATGQPDNNLFLPRLGGDPFGILLPPTLDGLKPLTLIPEPGVLTLFAMGAVIYVLLPWVRSPISLNPGERHIAGMKRFARS
jgi:hypothetical protein